MTVCITTYNRWSECALAVESVLHQSGANLELIVVDDCSDTEIPTDLLASLNAVGARYIRHRDNMGLAAARNTAICDATGEWFAFCDDDDQWPPDFAQAMLHGIVQRGHEADAAIALNSVKRRACNERLPSLPSIRDLMFAGVTPPVAAQVYRTSMLRRIGGYDTRVRSGVDHDLWVTLAATVNPSVALVWGVQPFVGNTPEPQRITTTEERRKEGVRHALEIWKPKIVSTFGHGFYRHFRKSYERYLKTKFFVLAIRRRSFLSAAARAFHPAAFLWILRKTAARFRLRPCCGVFPPYRRAPSNLNRE